MTYLAFAFAIGCVIPLQAAINQQLKFAVAGSALLAAIVSFVIGLVILVGTALASGQRLSALAGAAHVKPWQLAGGLLGAIFVYGTTLLAPRIGVAKMLALVIAGQMLTSLCLDSWGALGLVERGLTPARVCGALLIIAGAILVNADAFNRGG